MSPLPPDPYKILGVSKDAQTPEIRSAHRKLVLKCHPDKVQDPALKAEKQDEFQKVQQAYELLTDDRERQKYDDKVKLEELRKQFQNKANISTPRSTRYSGPDEARGTESRASPFKASASPSGVKYSYAGFSDEDLGRGPRVFEATPRYSSRREASFEKASERKSDKDREQRDRDRDSRERERERRRQQEDAIKRAEKDAKEQRRAEKRAREKQMAKDMKRQSEEKKRHAKPYIEPFDEEPPVVRSDRKKSSSTRKYDEKRDRSSGREDTPPRDVRPPKPQRSWTAKEEYATSYIQASKAKSTPGLQRSATTYHIRSVQPPAPTPPPIHGQSGPFAAPDDDDVRRSSARPRRESGDDPRLTRERSYRGSSREAMDNPPIISVSPSTRQAAPFFTSSSPPRGDLPRTKTMPHESGSYSRTPPELSRSQTFNVFETPDNPRGRDRSRMQSQVELETDEDDYNRRRDRKHRSRRRHHSPDQMRTENVSRYRVDGGRSKLEGAYTRRLDHDVVESYAGYYPPQDSRPSMPGRETSYSNSGGASFPKVKTTKSYGYDDVSYSTYGKPSRDYVYT